MNYLLIGLTILLVLNFMVYLFPPIVIRVRRLPVHGAKGLLVLSFIFLRYDVGEVVLRHELVHWEQQRRYTPIGAMLFNGWHYGKAFIRRESFICAWRNNPFEKEANEKMFQSTPIRKVWRVNG